MPADLTDGNNMGYVFQGHPGHALLPAIVAYPTATKTVFDRLDAATYYKAQANTSTPAGTAAPM